MPNPTLPPDIGVPSPLWANDINNWRADDASWLLARTNLRFNSTADWFASPLFSRGAIAYLVGTVAGSEELAVGGGTGVASYIMHGKNLKRSDDGLLHRTLGSSVLLSPTDVTVNPIFKIVSSDGTAKYTGATVSLNSDALVISTTGANTTVVSSKPVVITAASTSVTNTLAVGGALTVAGASTFTGAVTASQFNGTLNSSYITTPAAKFGNFDFSASLLKNFVGPVTMDFTGQNVEMRATKLTMKVPSAGLVLDDGSTNQGLVASVRVATVAPVNGTDNYPLGTIWVRV